MTPIRALAAPHPRHSRWQPILRTREGERRPTNVLQSGQLRNHQGTRQRRSQASPGRGLPTARRAQTPSGASRPIQDNRRLPAATPGGGKEQGQNGKPPLPVQLLPSRPDCSSCPSRASRRPRRVPRSHTEARLPNPVCSCGLRA
jgi:hypothetical protein